jgi:RNA polymerase sigma-70 factor
MGNINLNNETFEDLFRSYFQDLMKFVCSYVNDEEVAKDIVHDVFFALLKNKKHLDASYSMKSYLFTLSRNYALNYLKHLRVVAMNEREVTESLENAGEELEGYEERVSRLNEKMAELPEKQREVLVKCFVDGRKYKDVADEMEISVNSLKTHISRGLKFLRDELREDIVLLMFSLKS